MKIEHDKYYTNDEIVDKCWNILRENIDFNEVTEIIESSGGAGAWLEKIKSTGIEWEAYDIVPEHPEIKQADFLELEMDYKPGRLIGFNFPYGRSNCLSRKFYNKSVGVADYICSIQPISQLNNTNSMYYFDLIASVDLGKAMYSNKLVHCCFQVWKRPLKSVEAWRRKYGE